MKGKYGNAAEKRRAQTELENRVTVAERERDHLAREAAEAKERRDRDVRTLNQALADMRRERDGAVSPALSAAADTVRALKDEATHLRKANAQAIKTNRRLMHVISSAAREAGFHDKDARGAAYGLVDVEDRTLDSTDRARVANLRAGVDFLGLKDRANGFSGLTDVLAQFYDVPAMADGGATGTRSSLMTGSIPNARGQRTRGGSRSEAQPPSSRLQAVVRRPGFRHRRARL